MLRQTVHEAIGNLVSTRQRSLLALLGILIGAAAVIAMLNIGAIARNETVKQFQQMGTDILAIRSDSPTGMLLPDLQSVPANVPAVRQVAPLVIGGGSITFEGVTRSTGQVGVTEAFGTLAHLPIQSGRFISDLDKFELYCVVGGSLAADLSNPANTLQVGSKVRVGRYVFTVIGILAPALQSPMMPIDVNGSLFMSIPNTKRIMMNPLISTAMARMTQGADPDAAIAALTAYLGPKMGGMAPNVQSAAQLIAGMASQMRLFELLLGAVGSIALALGGVGVMNIMLVSVSERHREIGIRLAIGARRWDIQLLFLSEAVLLSVLGGILGIGLGIFASWVFARLSDWSFTVSMTAAPIGAGVSVAVGIFFGFYPAVMASRLDPIEALRSE
jgi:putative ABC transport system permease protein